jgi:hypothetical protein
VCHSEIVSTVNSFKNKGTDLFSIPSFVYKSFVNIIAPILSDIVNDSFSTGEFPDVLKKA